MRSLNGKTLALGAAFGLAALLVTGCGGSASAGVSCSSAKNCQAEAKVTVTWNTTCRAGTICRRQGGVFSEFASTAGRWLSTAMGMSDAVAADTTFNAADMRVDLTPSNIAVTNATGNFVISIKDGSTVMGQKTFAYYRSGNSLYATNPAAVNAWVAGYSGYDSVSVANANSDITYQVTNDSATTGSLGANLVYQGTSEASATAHFGVNSGGAGGCGVGVNCKQQ